MNAGFLGFEDSPLQIFYAVTCESTDQKKTCHTFAKFSKVRLYCIGIVHFT